MLNLFIIHRGNFKMLVVAVGFEQAVELANVGQWKYFSEIRSGEYNVTVESNVTYRIRHISPIDDLVYGKVIML